MNAIDPQLSIAVCFIMLLRPSSTPDRWLEHPDGKRHFQGCPLHLKVLPRTSGSWQG